MNIFLTAIYVIVAIILVLLIIMVIGKECATSTVYGSGESDCPVSIRLSKMDTDLFEMIRLLQHYRFGATYAGWLDPGEGVGNVEDFTKGFVLVSEEKCALSGFILCGMDSYGWGRISLIMVDNGRYFSGVGTALLKSALNMLPTNNPVSLTVSVKNKNAIAFFTKFGFVETVTTEKNVKMVRQPTVDHYAVFDNLFKQIPELVAADREHGSSSEEIKRAYFNKLDGYGINILRNPQSAPTAFICWYNHNGTLFIWFDAVLPTSIKDAKMLTETLYRSAIKEAKTRGMSRIEIQLSENDKSIRISVAEELGFKKLKSFSSKPPPGGVVRTYYELQI